MPILSIVVCQGAGSLAHNNREFIAKNVYADRTVNNITYVNQSIDEAYESCFGDSVREYNERQNRKDRKINGSEGYRSKIKNSGNGEKEFYEIIVQVGNLQKANVMSEEGEIVKNILDDYMKDFTERNPNLHVFNAVMHLDEQTPHLHIDYIPLATGYKQGLRVRNSLDKALKQQGIEGKANRFDNSTISWEKREKDYVEEIAKRYGVARAEEKGLGRKHLTVEQYKAVMSGIENMVEVLPNQIESKPILLDKNRVSVDKEELEQLERAAKLSIVHQNQTKKLIAALDEKNVDTQDNLSKFKEKYLEQVELNDRYEELKGEVDTLKEENKALNKENIELREELKTKDSLISKLKEKIEVLSKVIVTIGKGLNVLLFGEKEKYQSDNLTTEQKNLLKEMRQFKDKSLRQIDDYELIDESRKVELPKELIHKKINRDMER